MQRNSIFRVWPLALVALMILGLSLSACGGKDETTETDPTADAGSDTEELENVDLEEGEAFGDGDLGGDSAEGEDLDAAEEAAQPAILLQDVFFEYDKFDLSDNARDAINQNGRLLREHSSVRILIEGHCDERGTVQYNLALGEKRAREVKGYLVDLGIAASRIDVVSYGKEKPFVLGHDEASWSQNRRAHFVVR